MNPLPPQAYTQDTLRQAYSWIMSQPDYIKELATTPDVLVSIYNKYRTQGLDSLDRPSIQNFKNELKALAGMMGELNSTPETKTTAAPISQMAEPPPTKDLKLDEQSLKSIRLVRETLNLSSDQEALRALIALGIKKFTQGGF